MNQVLNQHIQRSPRYVLVPQDNCLIRLAGPKQTPWEEGTEIRDVSNTGLSFTAPMDLSPKLGEVIRVEFTVPGSKQMAAYAKVVRLEKMDQLNQVIAVEFELLNSAQRWNLKEGIGKKIDTETEKVITMGNTVSEVYSEAMGPLVKILFFFSVGVSLFSASFLLFAIFKFLNHPDWLNSLKSLLF